MDKAELLATRESDQKAFREALKRFRASSCVWYRHVAPGQLALHEPWQTMTSLARKGRVEIRLQYPQHPDVSAVRDFVWIELDEEKLLPDTTPLGRLKRIIGPLADECQESVVGFILPPKALEALLEIVEDSE